MGELKVRDVFIAGGIPVVTYVHRDELALEKKLKIGVAEGYQIITLTGPTKSGKTVLCRRVLDNSKSVWVEGGQVSGESGFWTQAAEKLGLPQETSTTRSSASKGGVSYVVQFEGQAGTVREERRYHSVKAAVLAYCRNNGICLVVDDFHYIEPALQKEIVRSLKAEIFEGLRVIFIAVPHRAFDAIQVEKEMEGRFIHIEVPPWDIRELLQISTLGFPRLKVNFPQVYAEEFAEEAFGSPILMQRFCLRTCLEYDIENTLSQERSISPSDAKREEIYSSVAEGYGLPTYKILVTGPQMRTDRLGRQLRRGDERVDIYKAVLIAVAETGPKPELSYNEIRDALRNTVIERDMPQKQQITNTLRYMSREARAKVRGEPPIEWKDEVLYITDPSLMFFLRWSLRTRDGSVSR